MQMLDRPHHEGDRVRLIGMRVGVTASQRDSNQIATSVIQ